METLPQGTDFSPGSGLILCLSLFASPLLASRRAGRRLSQIHGVFGDEDKLKALAKACSQGILEKQPPSFWQPHPWPVPCPRFTPSLRGPG